jgi:hypothetical protein
MGTVVSSLQDQIKDMGAAVSILQDQIKTCVPL